MKKIVTFDQIKESKYSGLDGAIAIAFPNADDVVKEGLIGLPFGTVEIDGQGWDWILKSSYYLFMVAQ